MLLYKANGAALSDARDRDGPVGHERTVRTVRTVKAESGPLKNTFITKRAMNELK